MPIDPSKVEWDAAPLAAKPPAIDPSKVQWDDAGEPGLMAQALPYAQGAARGASPTAAAMATGAALGAGVGSLAGGVGAIPGAAIGASMGAAALTLSDLAVAGYNALAQQLGYAPKVTPSQAIQAGAEALGIGKAGAAPVTEALVGGAVGAAGGAAGARALAPILQSPVSRGVANVMGEQVGMQAAAGGVGGAVPAALAEYTDISNPLALTAAGLASGAVVPAAVGIGNLGVRGANALVNRFGMISDPAAALRVQAAEGRGPQIIEALRAAPVSETGAPLTAAQASVGANAPAYTATMEQAARLAPAQSYEMALAQRAARGEMLARGAGTPEERTALVQARKEAAEPFYQAAKAPTNVADVEPARQIVETLMAENPGNRALMRELRAINRNMFTYDADGAPMLRTDAKQVSSIIDDLKTSISKQDNKYIKDQLMQVRDALVEGIPNLRKAQDVFREKSTPINQREGFVFLKEKLESPLMDEAERPGAFAGAVKALTSERDAPAALRRAVTDMPRYKRLEDLYPPEQLQMIDAVRLDLARDAKLRELVQRGRDATVDVTKIAKEMGAGESLPNPLNQTIALANRIINKLQGQLDKKLAMDLALEALNPQTAAAALERSLARQAKFERFKLTAPQTMRSGTFGASQIPALTINALSRQENQNAMAR